MLCPQMPMEAKSALARASRRKHNPAAICAAIRTNHRDDALVLAEFALWFPEGALWPNLLVESTMLAATVFAHYFVTGHGSLQLLCAHTPSETLLLGRAGVCVAHESVMVPLKRVFGGGESASTKTLECRDIELAAYTDSFKDLRLSHSLRVLDVELINCNQAMVLSMLNTEHRLRVKIRGPEQESAPRPALVSACSIDVQHGAMDVSQLPDIHHLAVTARDANMRLTAGSTSLPGQGSMIRTLRVQGMLEASAIQPWAGLQLLECAVDSWSTMITIMALQTLKALRITTGDAYALRALLQAVSVGAWPNLSLLEVTLQPDENGRTCMTQDPRILKLWGEVAEAVFVSRGITVVAKVGCIRFG